LPRRTVYRPGSKHSWRIISFSSPPPTEDPAHRPSPPRERMTQFTAGVVSATPVSLSKRPVRGWPVVLSYSRARPLDASIHDLAASPPTLLRSFIFRKQFITTEWAATHAVVNVSSVSVEVSFGVSVLMHPTCMRRLRYVVFQ
jgi:hypothetical protein